MTEDEPVKVDVADIIGELPDDVAAASDAPITLSGHFEPFDPKLITASINLRPVGIVHTQYSGHKVTFDAMLSVMTRLGEQLNEADRAVKQFVMWFPVTDRRVARRIARREHMKFRKQQDGTFMFKDRT